MHENKETKTWQKKKKIHDIFKNSDYYLLE